jgi:hypothetical protein
MLAEGNRYRDGEYPVVRAVVSYRDILVTASTIVNTENWLASTRIAKSAYHLMKWYVCPHNRLDAVAARQYNTKYVPVWRNADPVRVLTPRDIEANDGD